MAAATFPVRLIYMDRATYAKGGLVNAALAVKRAGRYGDTEVIHINKAELAELTRQWGPPTINPRTGMPEFFLGGLGKILKKALPIATIAANFIPGVGPLVSAGLGGLNGLVSGGGLKGALLGAASGALGSGGAGSLASGLGGSILGAGASQVAKSALGNALTSGVIGGLGGHNVLQSALAGGASGAMQGLMAKPPVGAGAGTVAPVDPATAAAAAPNPAAELPALSTAPTANAAGFDPTSFAGGPAAAAAAPAAAAAAPLAAAAKPDFWNQNFLGNKIGLTNKTVIPLLGVGAALAAGLGKSTSGGTMPTSSQFFGNTFSGTGLPTSNLSTGTRQTNSRPMDQYARAGYMPEYQYFTGMAGGGKVDPSNVVKGVGDGRADTVDALLSDGEYVMDAETVSMLGNGSNKAGAKALDQLRVNLRKHKGSNMAKGALSAKAKSPEAYMRRAG